MRPARGRRLRFYLAFGVLALGAVIMLAMRMSRPDFFTGATLPRSTASRDAQEQRNAVTAGAPAE